MSLISCIEISWLFMISWTRFLQKQPCSRYCTTFSTVRVILFEVLFDDKVNICLNIFPEDNKLFVDFTSFEAHLWGQPCLLLGHKHVEWNLYWQYNLGDSGELFFRLLILSFSFYYSFIRVLYFNFVTFWFNSFSIIYILCADNNVL